MVDEKSEEDLLDVAIKSHEVLVTANTVFPFTLVPDTITVDREKLTIAKRRFFRIANIITVQIQDIFSVEAHVGPFFGSIHMTSRYFVRNPQIINFLWRADAIKIQRILEGYIIATQKKIDCTKIPKEDLIVMLEDLGKGVSD